MKTFVLGIDPGETTGIGLVNPDGKIIGTKEVYKDPLEIGRVILTVKEKYSPLTVVIEDFVGGGPERREWTCRLGEGMLHNPQRRYCMIEPARTFLKNSSFKFSNHTMDASAHALALWEVQ